MTTSYQFPQGVPTSTHPTASTWHCGDPFAEQRAAHDTGVLIDLRHLSVLHVAGEDAPSWLHSLLAQKVVDMPVLSPTHSELRHAYILDAHGHICEECWVARTPDGYFLATPREHRDSLQEYLTSMVFWSNVTVTTTDDSVCAIVNTAATDTAATSQPLLSPAVSALLDSKHVITAQGRPRGIPTALLYIPPTTDCASLVNELCATGLTTTGKWTWDALRCAAGLPEITTDMDDKSLPHEYNSVGEPDTGAGASVTKGCYRGQETVAKIHNVGLPPRRQIVLLLDGSSEVRPVPGTDLYADADYRKSVGRIGTVVDHWEYGPLALGLVRRTIEDSQELFWKTDEDAGKASIMGELSVHPDGHRAGREAVQSFRSSARHRNL